MDYNGNQDILQNRKVGFLCSKRCPAEVVLKSYDWAREQREKGITVVCGNHSQIEKDVFEILLKGRQPLILALARGLQKKWQPDVVEAVEANRLLIATDFPEDVKRVTRSNARTRNQMILQMSDEIMIGYKSPGGMLDSLVKNSTAMQNKVLNVIN